MKKIIYSVLVALITISCSQEEDSTMDTPLTAPQTLYGQVPDFESRALWEYQPESWDHTETINSRTYAVVDPTDPLQYFQYWSEGDAISVFFTNQNLKYTLTEFVNGEEDYGHFQLNGTAIDGMELETEDYFAIYPYKENTSINYHNGVVTYNFPKTQHYNGDSYANGENGMIACEPKDGDGKLYFQNFCSYLQLRLIAQENAPKTVKQIILVANNSNDKMTGDAAIKFEGTNPLVDMKMTAGNQITLDCGTGVDLSQDMDNPSKFWFVLPGDFTFTNGFSITVTFNDNTYFKKSTEKTIFIERSHIKPMATFETEDEEDDMTVGPIRYKYNDSTITDPYPLGDQFYGEDGSKLQVINQVYDEETGEWVVYLSGKLGTIGGNNFQQKKPDISYIKIEESTDGPIIISDFAFYNCTAESIKIHNDIESIGKAALKGSKVNQLLIDGNVSVINEGAFTGCTRLQTFEATSVETIQDGAFQMCTNLTTLSIPGLKYLGANAFEDCTSLESVNLDSIITIDDGAFFGCYNITTVTISEYCTMIGEGAFCNAESLETVYCYAIKPPFIKTDNPDGSYVFDATADNLCIYIPMGSLSDYTDPNYFVNNNSGYESPVQATVNWWYQEYTGKLKVMEN